MARLASPRPDTFEECVSAELQKVNTFFGEKLDELENKVALLQRATRRMKAPASTQRTGQASTSKDCSC